MSIMTHRVPGNQAIEKWKQWRAEFQQGGPYPFLIGGEQDLQTFGEALAAQEFSPDEIIARAHNIDWQQWMVQREQQMMAVQGNIKTFRTELISDWPDDALPHKEFSIHRDIISRKLHDEVTIGSVPLEEPWTLPAWINFGGWNECPEPEVQCALHRHWQEVYGAEIAGVSGDVVECVVTRPPSDRDAALELAWQQFFYCEDIVYQGTESVTALAATLVNAPIWYFWWD